MAPVEESPLCIAYATDDGYAPYLLVAMASALHHLKPGRRCEITVLGTGISPYWQTRLEEVAASRENTQLTFIDATQLDEEVAAILARRGKKGKVTKWSYTTYYRLFLARLLPECRRLVYLDVDILVCDDLALIHDMDMQGKGIGCVVDVCLCHDATCRESRCHLAASGFDMQRYFNAGILVLNLERWREMGHMEQLVADKLCELPNLAYPDQDALNSLFAEDRVDMDARWNFLTPQMDAVFEDEYFTRQRDRIASEGSFGIIHYAGVKPWREPVQTPFAAQWWAAARRAGVEGDITLHEAMLLRRYLKGRQEARRLKSLKFQAFLLRLQLLMAWSARRRMRLEGRLQRMERKIAVAAAGKACRL